MAKAAGEGVSSPALTASSSKSVEEDGQREQQGAEKVEEKKQLNKKELEVTVSAAVPIKQVQETLSVTTELGNRGEEPFTSRCCPRPFLTHLAMRPSPPPSWRRRLSTAAPLRR